MTDNLKHVLEAVSAASISTNLLRKTVTQSKLVSLDTLFGERVETDADTSVKAAVAAAHHSSVLFCIRPASPSNCAHLLGADLLEEGGGAGAGAGSGAGGGDGANGAAGAGESLGAVTAAAVNLSDAAQAQRHEVELASLHDTASLYCTSTDGTAGKQEPQVEPSKMSGRPELRSTATPGPSSPFSSGNSLGSKGTIAEPNGSIGLGNDAKTAASANIPGSERQRTLAHVTESNQVSTNGLPNNSAQHEDPPLQGIQGLTKTISTVLSTINSIASNAKAAGLTGIWRAMAA